MRALVVGLFLGVGLVACDSTRPVSDADKTALAQHEAQWASRSFHSYVYDYSETQLSSSFNARITVVNDTVSSVIDPQTGQPPATPRSWPTIDGIFNEANFAVQDGNFTISIEYDDTYGYPTVFNAQSNNPGGGVLVRASNLQPRE
ncbi:MAG: DUF6174 domain-containing protein [Gemmatimonadota bacterium]|nr:DUF6174 domain-containing protein [Gemmatimonadota bacterium]